MKSLKVTNLEMLKCQDFNVFSQSHAFIFVFAFFSSSYFCWAVYVFSLLCLLNLLFLTSWVHEIKPLNKHLFKRNWDMRWAHWREKIWLRSYFPLSTESQLYLAIFWSHSSWNHHPLLIQSFPSLQLKWWEPLLLSWNVSSKIFKWNNQCVDSGGGFQTDDLDSI